MVVYENDLVIVKQRKDMFYCYLKDDNKVVSIAPDVGNAILNLQVLVENGEDY